MSRLRSRRIPGSKPDSTAEGEYPSYMWALNLPPRVLNALCGSLEKGDVSVGLRLNIRTIGIEARVIPLDQILYADVEEIPSILKMIFRAETACDSRLHFVVTTFSYAGTDGSCSEQDWHYWRDGHTLSNSSGTSAAVVTARFCTRTSFVVEQRLLF
ncbi:hypothetical protein AVEN_68513-1 [Araneus ventricosus]|uniref:Uncharacterized protein n=1 Tax=Araneus ventricosus TaxID=182803 RepID=A0A4Y2N1I3_ARAVE|nr:hypothetical protein AVEN_68513-1 [Araneus ventricosus]